MSRELSEAIGRLEIALRTDSKYPNGHGHGETAAAAREVIEVFCEERKRSRSSIGDLLRTDEAKSAIRDVLREMCPDDYALLIEVERERAPDFSGAADREAVAGKPKDTTDEHTDEE